MFFHDFLKLWYFGTKTWQKNELFHIFDIRILLIKRCSRPRKLVERVDRLWST